MGNELEVKGSNELSTEVKRVSVNAVYGEDGHKELSAYANCPKPTQEDYEACLARLISAYPSSFAHKSESELKVFMEILKEAVDYAGMARDQLKRAVMECICNKKQYGDFCIADITGFRKNIKFYTYHETDCGTMRGYASTPIRFHNNELAYVKMQDLEIARQMYKNGVKFI